MSPIKTKIPPPEASTELHRLLGMTPEQVREDLVTEGLDPTAEIQAMRRLGRIAAARHAEQIGREWIYPHEVALPFKRFQDAVAAGEPAWTGGSEPSDASSILDVLRDGDPDGIIWARVSGWSMRDAGIHHGDMVLVNVKIEANDGDIVLAHIEGQGQVIKRLHIIGENKGVELLSANPDFDPIVIADSLGLRIHGVVIGRAGKIS